MHLTHLHPHTHAHMQVIVILQEGIEQSVTMQRVVKTTKGPGYSSLKGCNPQQGQPTFSRERENSKHWLVTPRFPLPSLRPGQGVHLQKGLVSGTCSRSGARVPPGSSATQKHHSQNHTLKCKGGARLSGCHGNSSFSTTEVKRIGNSGVV